MVGGPRVFSSFMGVVVVSEVQRGEMAGVGPGDVQ